jgi:hypothetical protein
MKPMANTSCPSPDILIGLNLLDSRPGETCYPWKINPRQFIDFAQKELGSSEPRAMINALSHAKRAIHAHVDFLLLNHGASMRGKPFPAKLEVLALFGVLTPALLNKHNRLRNAVEHDYEVPTEEEVRELIEVAQLFLSATKDFTRPLPDSVMFGSNDLLRHVVISCSPNSRDLAITVTSPGADGGTWTIYDNNVAAWAAWINQLLKSMKGHDDPYNNCG